MRSRGFLTSLRSKVFFGVLGGLLLVTAVAEVVLYRQAVWFSEKEQFERLKRYAVALVEVVYLDENNRLKIYPDWENRIRIGRADRTEYFEFKTMDDDFITDSHNLGGDSLPGVGGHGRYKLVDYGNIFLGVYEHHFPIAATNQSQPAYKLLVAENTGLISDARSATIRTLALFTPLALVAAFVISFGLTAITFSSISRFRGRVQALKRADSKSHLDLQGVDKEMIPLGAALNNYIDQINQHVIHESRLLADTAHELRIPLANMRAELDELASANSEGAKFTLALKKIEKNVTGLQWMTDNMLLLYRIESGKYRPRMSLINIKDELQSKSRSLPFDEDVNIKFSGASVNVCSNRSVINLIVTQLVHNACQYAPGSDVHIRWRMEADRVLLHVDDAGPGIPEPERERIFERMYRFEDLNQPLSSGSGLGLALVRLYAESVSASTECTNSPEGGARFTVTFPANCSEDTVADA